MEIAIIAAIVVFAALVAGVVLHVARHRGAAPGEQTGAQEPTPDRERESRERAVEQRGAELLERRIELDSRRGMLGGRDDIEAELERLENRMQAGEITEEDFEREKIRLLEGS